jgi:oligopeptide transport system ATP-binding protein
MYAGYIVETGTADEIFHNPRHPYTLGLLNSVPRLDQVSGEKLIPIEGLPPDLGHLPPGCSFYARCTYRLDKCREEYPPLQMVAEGHYAACWVDVTKERPAVNGN